MTMLGPKTVCPRACLSFDICLFFQIINSYYTIPTFNDPEKVVV